MSASPRILNFPLVVERQRPPETEGGSLFELLKQNTAKTPPASEITPSAPSQVGTLAFPASSLVVEKQIESLVRGGDVEVRPTGYANLRVRQFVLSAYSILSDKKSKLKIPVPVIDTEDDGAIMVSWLHANKYLAAKFGATPEARSRLYFEQDNEHGTADLSEENLVAKLKWLSER